MPSESQLFRLLLRLLPREVREARGEEVLAYWCLQAREARYSGVAGRIRLLGALAHDVVSSHRSVGTHRWDGGAEMFRSSGQDLRYAWRALAGAPLFTALAAITLALGVGATAAVYSVVSSVVLDPLPYPDADQLVDVPRTVREGRTRSVSWPDFRDWRDRNSPFLTLSAHAESEQTFEWDGGAEALSGALVARNFFAVMGVPPALGRSFSADEDRLHGADAIILGHGMWLDRFGADPDVLGQTIPVDGKQLPIIGVMPAGFAAPGDDTRFWMPLQADELLESVGLPTGTRGLSFLTVVGRLADGVTLEDASERLRTIAAAVDEEAQRPSDRRSEPILVPLLEATVGDVRATLLMVLAAAALVLLVAVANAIGLALSRTAARERELAVRAALGAARGRIARQLLTEGMLLGAVAAILGIGISWGLQEAVGLLAPPEIPRLDRIGFGADTFVVLLGAAGGTGFLLGFGPAVAAYRTTPGTVISSARGTTVGRRSLTPQRALVSFQVAMSVILLTGAVLLTRSFSRLTGVELGFDPNATIVATVQPSETRYASPEALDAFYDRLLTEVRGIPGVASASTTYSPPFVGNALRTGVAPEGSDEDPQDPTMASTVIVREGYFDANGVPLLAGRAFDGTERLGEPPVAIVSQSLADRFWPGESPIGRRFVFTGHMQGSADSFDDSYFPDEPYTVIGVAGDVRRDGYSEQPALEYYRPHSQITWGFQYLLVRTEAGHEDVSETLRASVWGIDPTIPVRSIRTLDSYLADSSAAPRFRTLLVGIFAATTGLLAMVGLYAVMALAVTRRTREVGIRIALGAHRSGVVKGVLLEGLRLVLVGTVAGLAASLIGGRFLSEMLFGIEATDPVTYVAVVVSTGSVAMIACYGPARRAARVDPIRSLAEE